MNSVITKISNNISLSADDDYVLGLNYNNRKATGKDLYELTKAYKSLGIDIELENSTDSLYSIPFNRNIDLSKNIGSKNLTYYKLPKHTLIMMDYCKYDKYLSCYTEFGYYNKDVKIPQIKEGNNMWMTPTMLEYNTMKDSIAKSNGNVIVFG